jgi:hypothetical protein
LIVKTPDVLVKRTVTTLRTVGVRAGTNVREDYTHLVPVEADNTWTLRPNNVRPLNRPLVTTSVARQLVSTPVTEQKTPHVKHGTVVTVEPTLKARVPTPTNNTMWLQPLVLLPPLLDVKILDVMERVTVITSQAIPVSRTTNAPVEFTQQELVLLVKCSLFRPINNQVHA